MTFQTNIVICGSMSFESEMSEIGDALSRKGFQVHLPEKAKPGTIWSAADIDEVTQTKRQFIDEHLQKIRSADLVLIANFNKHGIPGYIGASALMEAAFTYSLAKPLILLNYPEEQSCQLEILSIATRILHGEIDALTGIARADD